MSILEKQQILANGIILASYPIDFNVENEQELVISYDGEIFYIITDLNGNII